MKSIFLLILLYSIPFCSFAQQSLLLDEDFVNNQQNWPEQSNSNAVQQIQDGHYLLKNIRQTPVFSLFKEIGLNHYADYSIELRLKNLTSNPEKSYAITWGAKNVRTALMLNITQEYYYVDKLEKGKAITLSPKLKSDLLYGKGQYNIIKIEKKDTRIYVYFNGYKVNECYQQAINGSQLGFILEPSVEIEIDWIKVKQGQAKDSKPNAQIALEKRPKNSVFHDDFTQKSSRWTFKNNAQQQAIYKDGQLQLSSKTIPSFDASYVMLPFNQDQDFYIESKFSIEQGDERTKFGIIFGASTTADYYLFQINPSGYFSLDKYEQKSKVSLCSWLRNAAIKGLKQSQRIGIQKKGQRYFFFINDKLVYSCYNLPLFGNKFGLMASQYKALNVDHFEVRQAEAKLHLIEDANKTLQRINLGTAINSSTPELAPIIAPDGQSLYFVREGHPQNLGQRKLSDVWLSTRDASGNWSAAKNMNSPINTPAYNGISSVSADNNSLYHTGIYTKNNQKLKAILFNSIKGPKGWTNPRPIKVENFYNLETSLATFLSPNKKIFLLSTKQLDSYGSNDIYVSFEENGQFSTPINLGPDINTTGREMTPFLAADNKTLYFASEGLPGYGSADIYVSQRLDDSWQKWSKPQNLGPSINSKDWDAYFSLPASGQKAYMVSTQNSLGREDIFELDMPKSAQPEAVILVKGRVINAETKKPMMAIIDYKELDSERESGSASSSFKDGKFQIILPKGKEYSFLAKRKGFYSVSEHINVKDLGNYRELEQDLYLYPLKEGQAFRLNNIFFDVAKASLRKESNAELNRLVNLIELYPQIQLEIQGHTDNKGSDASNLNLSQKRAEAVLRYLTLQGIAKGKLKAKGYGESQPVASNDHEEGRQLNRRVEISIISLGLAKKANKRLGFFSKNIKSEQCQKNDIYILRDLHFNSNKASFSTDSKISIKELLTFLKQHPNKQIEIGVHCDGIDDIDYQKLSEERLANIQSLIKKLAIGNPQIRYKAYGKRQTRVSSFSAEGRRKNNRVEIRFL